MVQIFGTVFAALIGLAFGSFLNVCLTRWPAGESIAKPRSHCRHCAHTLAWWENVPLLSWLALRGRCRSCRAWIGWRYPIVELVVGTAWAVAAWQMFAELLSPGWTATSIFDSLLFGAQKMILCWILVGLAVLDAEHLWLPDWGTLGGAALGLPFAFLRLAVHWISASVSMEWTTAHELATFRAHLFDVILRWVFGILAVPALFLLTRWIYRQVRGREGIGLGDVKLVLLLAVWLGLAPTLLAFVLGVVLGAAVALGLLAVPSLRRNIDQWAFTKLPLGTFLCVGGIVSSLWGREIIAAYLRWSGF